MNGSVIYDRRRGILKKKYKHAYSNGILMQRCCFFIGSYEQNRSNVINLIINIKAILRLSEFLRSINIITVV